MRLTDINYKYAKCSCFRFCVFRSIIYKTMMLSSIIMSNVRTLQQSFQNLGYVFQDVWLISKSPLFIIEGMILKEYRVTCIYICYLLFMIIWKESSMLIVLSWACNLTLDCSKFSYSTWKSKAAEAFSALMPSNSSFSGSLLS